MGSFFLRIAHICFGLGFIILAGVGATAYWSVTSFHETVDVTTRSLAIQAKLNDIRNPLRDAESGHRGYLLTGLDVYLQKFERATPDVDMHIEELEALLAGDAESLATVEELKPLIEAKILAMTNSVKTMKGGKPAAARAMVHGTKDKFYMDQIVSLLDTIDQAQLKGLRRSSELKRRYILSKAYVVGGSVLGLFIAALALYFFRRETARRARIEADLRKARELAQQASQLKSEFLANVSHEIRTPLNGIVGTAELLEESEALNDIDRKYAETIRTSGNTLVRIINDLLDFSKIEAGKLDLVIGNFSPRQLIDDAVSLFAARAQKKGLEVITAFDPHIPATLQGDAERISQILFNLIGNAIKFTAQGSVTIECRVSEGAGTISPTIEVSVRDTGIGLSKQALDRLFVPFAQGGVQVSRRFGGTGLGLSISKRLLELMGGRIEVVSQEGRGACFSFSIPLFDPAPQPRSSMGEDLVLITRRVIEKVTPLRATAPVSLHEVKARAPGLQRNVKVLVAEDDEVNRMLAREHFERIGCKVDVVENGQEAVTAVQSGSYDIVFMDCQMPVMDGYEAVRAIRAAETDAVSRIPVVAMTANAMAGDREKCLAAGMSDHVAKPVRREDIVQALDKWAPSATPPSPVVDTAVLMKLAAQTDESVVDKVVGTYLTNLPEYLRRLEGAFAEKDPETLRRSAHAFKSSSAGLGAMALFELCRELESASPESALKDAERLLPRIREATALTERSLRGRLTKVRAAA